MMQPKSLKDDYLSEAAAAKFLGIRPSTLTTWRWRGKGPRFTKFARRVYYSRASLESWLKACEVTPVRAEERAMAAR